MLNFLLETFVLGMKNLGLHKLRSLLTALGIIFGVAAVIIMVAIGEGTKQTALEQLQQLGARNILVKSVPPPESASASGRTQRMLEYGIMRDDLKRLQLLPGVKRVVPLRDTEQNVTYRDIIASSAHAIGTTPEIFNVINLRIEPGRGRYFTELEYDRAAPVCVIGAAVARHLFPYEDPIGRKIRIGVAGVNAIILDVVGILEPTGLRAGSEGAAMIGRDLDLDIYFPLTLARSAFGDTMFKLRPGSVESRRFQLTEIWLEANLVDQVEILASMTENIMSTAHGELVDYQVKAPIQLLRNAERLNRMFNFIMGGTASISLLVGGIGIMNIMLATVTERTREIGIRRAMGAKRRHITLQFLIETTLISLTGGLIGIALGAGIAGALPFVVHAISNQTYPTSITTWSVVGSFVVSGIIGIGFGLYPAVIAAHMNPIEALRHE